MPWRATTALIETGRGGQVQVDRRLVPVAALGLEEDHRVGACDRLLDHRVRVRRVGAGDHPQTRGVRELRLGRLAVVLDRADAPAERNTDHDRQLDGAE